MSVSVFRAGILRRIAAVTARNGDSAVCRRRYSDSCSRRSDRSYYNYNDGKCANSSSSSSSDNAGSTKKSKWADFKLLFYRFARIGRFLAAGTILYQGGYYHGLKWYAKDPYLAECHLTDNFIKANSTDKKSDSVVNEDHIDYTRLNIIAKKIHSSAINLTHHKIDELKKKKQLMTDKSELRDNTIETKLWEDNLRKLSGNWRIVLIKSKVPNAFVSELVPRKIFINTAVIHEMNASDDEVALLLGHELSHLLLDHGENKHNLEEVLAVAAIVLMSFIDPTGWFALVFDSFLFTFITAVKAGFSRHEETEADHLGVLLASMSCYNPVNGALLMKKFSEFEKDKISYSFLTSWSSTHPSSISRYEDLRTLGARYESENRSHCASLKSVWGSLFKR